MLIGKGDVLELLHSFLVNGIELAFAEQAMSLADAHEPNFAI